MSKKKKTENDVEAFWWGAEKPAKDDGEGFVSQLRDLVKGAVREVVKELDAEAEAEETKKEEKEEPTSDG